MVWPLEQEEESYKSKLFYFKGMNDNVSRHAKSLSVESGAQLGEVLSEDESVSRNNRMSPASRSAPAPRYRSAKDEAALAELQSREMQFKTDMEQMKERFAKLLLGEDMSGGGKGVSSALALSNAITNLAASVFGEQRRLEPMQADRKARWKKEINWLLSVTDHIVEFAPSQQTNNDGTSMEIMTTRQRTDLHMNIPALKKLDTMLTDCLDNFKEQNEFTYVSRDAAGVEKPKSKRAEDKWWLPTVKVPPNGLSDRSRKFLQHQKDCVNQVLKAAMAINAQVISEMEIPDTYIESLPKNGRASLGDSIYKNITEDFFDPDEFLCMMDLSSEHKILDLKNRIEASIVIWKRKMNQKDGKSAWGSAVSLEKRELFEDRAETILLLLKQRFPGLAQSDLDISKIQFNRDVGHAVLESYSRILESLAHTVLSRIEDVLYADQLAENPSNAACRRKFTREKDNRPREEDNSNNNNTAAKSLAAKTLFDFMDWGSDQCNSKPKKEGYEESFKDGDEAMMAKLGNVVTHKKSSYLETLGGMRSPTARH